MGFNADLTSSSLSPSFPAGLCSALHENFERLLTMVAAGDTADYHNGQQGDLWDAQNDMAAAQIGSLIAVLLCRIRSRRGAPQPLSAQPTED
jgi:putative membrane protein